MSIGQQFSWKRQIQGKTGTAGAQQSRAQHTQQARRQHSQNKAERAQQARRQHSQNKAECAQQARGKAVQTQSTAEHRQQARSRADKTRGPAYKSQHCKSQNCTSSFGAAGMMLKERHWFALLLTLLWLGSLQMHTHTHTLCFTCCKLQCLYIRELHLSVNLL